MTKEYIGIERTPTMGASSWIYYTPYQERLELAFQALRQRVFETGNYSQFWQIFDYEEYEGLVDMDGNDIVPAIAPPQTIEEALKRSQTAGTHSILDISRLITDTRYFGDVPLQEKVIQALLEDAKPTKALIEAVVFEENIWSRLDQLFQAERWNKTHGSRGLFALSEDVLQFFAVEHPQEELVETLLAREDIWKQTRRCLCYVIKTMALVTRYGTVRPFSSEHLLRLFGSERPTKAVVEAAVEQGDIWKIIRRVMGYYAIIYQNNVPHEILFVGVSGD